MIPGEVNEGSPRWVQRSDVEDELGKLQTIINILDTLPAPSRYRVLDYLIARFSEPAEAP